MIRITMLNSNMFIVDVPRSMVVKKVSYSGKDRYKFIGGIAKNKKDFDGRGRKHARRR